MLTETQIIIDNMDILIHKVDQERAIHRLVVMLGPGTWYLVPGTWYLVPGTWYLVPGTWYLVPGTWYLVPAIKSFSLIAIDSTNLSYNFSRISKRLTELGKLSWNHDNKYQPFYFN